ncbi:hypothetical protein COT40_02240 [Candidatus Peregrinibacteria bacterium CG08_land_8_20_14_0_20_41_10]|nr:MAG: hypothetical protein COT40_02240 [Candidatus Peregrinibacteria bacterium CG08_land_8_20_14_0_20_41_10]
MAWMFKKRGVLCLKKAQLSDELELQLIDWGAEEIKEEDSVVEILTPFEKLNTIKLALEKKGITPENAEITYHPTTAILIKNPEEAGRMVRLMEELEEDEDVNEVYANFEIEEGLC